MLRHAGLALAALIGFSAQAGAQDSLAAFYKGRNVSIIIGSSPGGGYDLYGRLI